jgi:hypothetical protein
MQIDRTALVEEYRAAIDALERTLRACPEELWDRSVWPVRTTDPWVWPAAGTEPVPERTEESIQRFSAFWVVAYHCLWFLDYYATNDAERFRSPEMVRGGPEEQGFAADGAVALPTGQVSRAVLLEYTAYCRRKVEEEIRRAAEADFRRPRPSGHPHAGETYAELLEGNLAHVREHGGQLERFLAEHAATR